MSAAGCGGKKENENKTLLESIKEKGVLTIAMEGTWSPWTYHNEKDELVGFDVEVAEYIADYLGVKAKFVEGEWDGLFAGLDSGMYDIIVNGVDKTEEIRFFRPLCVQSHRSCCAKRQQKDKEL